MRSPASSMPELRRMKPGETSSMPQRSRRSAELCTPPKLVASATSRHAPRNACARSSVSRSKHTTQPKRPPKCAAA